MPKLSDLDLQVQTSPQSRENEKINLVESPCIRNCCLDGKDICLGCFRHLDEITGWQGFTNKEKKKVLLKCQQRCELS